MAIQQKLETPTPPNLVYPAEVYERRIFNETNGSLNSYFRKLTAVLGSVFGVRGSRYINAPYGAFQSTADQTAAAINTAYAMTFNTTDYSNGVTVVSSSRITVTDSGIYNLQWSGQFENTDSQDHDVRVWIKVNGTNLVGSTGFAGIPSKHGSVNGHTIVAWNYFLSLNANDYVELWWETDSTAVSIQAYAAGSFYPSTASLIATMQFVSNTM
jgi:hypothetical protein